MSTHTTEIEHLLYRYAEYMDTGRLEDAAMLFKHAQLRFDDGDLRDSSDLLKEFRANVMIHPCGTPMTKHVVTNPIVQVDETLSRATCQSYYTVAQATQELPLQIIASGRYHDEFERVDGIWRFVYRDYSLLDHIGETREHMTSAPAWARKSLSATDHAGVANVVNCYVHAVDDRDWDLLVGIFTPDAIVRYGKPDDPPLSGSTEILAMFRSQLDGGGQSHHLMSSPWITVDGDTAKVVCKARVIHASTEMHSVSRSYEFLGVYHYGLQRMSGGWRISELRCELRHELGISPTIQSE